MISQQYLSLLSMCMRVVVLLLAGALSAKAAASPNLSLGTAKIHLDGDRVTVSTGVIERVWRRTGQGLVTVSLRDLTTNKDWAIKPKHTCDWNFPGALAHTDVGEWVSTQSRISDDCGFVGKHLELVSTFLYPSSKLMVQHVVWAFSGAPGLRTQLRVKALPGYDAGGKTTADISYKDSGATFLKPGARAEYLPLDFSIRNERLYWGYYNNPGNRHDQSQDMLKEQVIKGWPVFLREDIDWASAVAVKYGDAGVILVKESPKTVNQAAHGTGAFFANPHGLSSTGWGLTPAEIIHDRYRECWANWTIIYQGGEDGIQKALKSFDAARYPVFPERDMFILANTWGPANPQGSQFTEEDFVVKEIPELVKIGVDVLQIDDGWQKSGGGAGAKDYQPKYPDGWKNIKAAADQANLRLGLWVAIRNASLADLKQNLDELGFITWKADFDRLQSRSDYEARCASYREVLKHSWMKTQFTLCPEYDDPRYGWYFAREYGSIYFQNIQEAKPDHLTMAPFQVLRQHWLMAKYFPANKLQVMLQNPKRVGTFSDAKQHGHDYCFAMGLPFVPCFFQSAQYLDVDGRKVLQELIALYKTCREDIFTSLTYPIGDLPDNESWSGFQMASTRIPDSGHLLLFRELHNTQSKRTLQLKFLADKTISLNDLRTGATRSGRADADGFVEFEIRQPADYSLLHYQIQ